MSGKPAARITDSVVKGKIVTGSLTVLIGSQGGLACSVCPGGITVGSPVNPQLGAKVLLGAQDLDFALPSAALPVAWQRQYSSYVNPEHGAACGLLGHGWHLLQELSIRLQDEATLLLDASGRVITFDQPLVPGGQLHSASEDLWLLRGGSTEPDGGTAPWAANPRWSHVEQALVRNPQAILAVSGDGDTLWGFGPAPGEPVDGPWRLMAQIDRFGRRQLYHYSDGTTPEAGHSASKDLIPAGRLVSLSDGTGRRYRLLHQRIHGGKDAQGLNGLWGADDGWRVTGVDLTQDPLNPLSTPIAPITLVRYGYSSAGDLITVHDRAGQLVREFEWDHHRISAHRHASGPWHRYRYESAQPGARVIEHSNQEGLSYRFDYLAQPPGPDGQPRAATRVSDSLDRIETYYFEGAAGLSRLIAHHKADGSRWLQAYDSFGRLASRTDPLGRSVHLRRDGQGRLIGVQLPDGRSTQQEHDEATGRLLQSTDTAGATTGYQYDAWGRLTQITQADGSTERYHYPDPQEAPLTCDSPRRIEDAQGGSKQLAWSDAGQLLSYTDCSGHSTHYHYDRWGALIEVDNALGQRQRHQRDGQGRIVASELPNGQIERYHYDSAGHLTRIDPAQPAGTSSETQTADPSIHLRYDLWGRLVQRTHGGLTLAFEYDSAGRLLRLVNENGSQSRFAWDALDRLVQEEGFDQRLQRYRWDAAGQLMEATDGNAAQQSSSHYRWDEGGRLAERQLPATPHAPAQTHRYEWDAAGRLTAASVWQHTGENTAENTIQRQSRIALERDALGRITAEVQQLYRPGKDGNVGGGADQIEYEHRIAHTLDRLGGRQHSQLQGLGEIAWLTYGSGHVHGLQLNGASLIDFERDNLHREVRRSLHPPTPAADAHHPLQVQRQWDSLGRLTALGTTGLQALQPTDAQAHALIGQILGRRYHYDSLGQLVAIEQAGAPGQAAQLLRYGYDSAGRLRAATDSQHPQTTTRWQLDPAGNRLPAPGAPGATGQTNTQDNWAAQVHAHWRHTDFNLMGLGHLAGQRQGPVQRWEDNRIGFTEDRVWRYDPCGNRIAQMQADHSQQQLHYDGAHQLIAVRSSQIQGNAEQLRHHSRYTYDALGRRLKQQVESADGNPTRTHYYGWDGDRLIHTERQQHGDDTRHIEHTIYEPGSFTPLVRLSTTASGDPQNEPHLLVQAIAAGLPDQDDPNHRPALALMQTMLSAMPRDMQQDAARHLRHTLEHGLPPGAQAMLGEQAESTARLLSGMQAKLQEQEKEQHARIAIHHYHCDHLGTPMALTDQTGQVAWAAKLDPWGNVLQEYNPQGIHQAIRLPGQHHDRETGLYYNRHRYYDPVVGSYVNQDPIGLAGGVNKILYSESSPTSKIDPTGLNTVAIGAGVGASVGGPIGAVVGAAIGVAVLGVLWMASRPSSNTTSVSKTASELSIAHNNAAQIGDRSSYQGYGGNCTPDDHDKLDDEKKDACDKSKGLTCGKNEIDYGKADKIKKCIDARINIARKCFNGGDKGHNTQINQLYSIIGKCTGQAE
ncbi:YD repeat protein [Delftia acidovorans SPH-1]|uniref:YD repeat protein n=3 Tax=Delftia acidovorans TaxID=80866 RepID=A9C0N8_DELAS|nr:RHS repeat-associated core domain-containing protein [Delftia acidovorans]ABX37111.1 YD repeat protein [Delftia acidovorans SPH-1]